MEEVMRTYCRCATCNIDSNSQPEGLMWATEIECFPCFEKKCKEQKLNGPTEVLIDGVSYYRQSTEQTEVNRLLNDLYGAIWIEAIYDARSVESQLFAKKLLPTIQKVNKILKFKK